MLLVVRGRVRDERDLDAIGDRLADRKPHIEACAQRRLVGHVHDQIRGVDIDRDRDALAEEIILDEDRVQ